MLSPAASSLIGCRAGGGSFCFPLDGVRGIQRADLVEWGGGEAAATGVVGHLAAFGTDVPVVGLARRLGLDGGPDGEEAGAGGRSPGAIVVFDHPERPWGLLVDRVFRLPRLSADDRLPLPRIADARGRSLFAGVVRLGEALALHLALDRLHPSVPPAADPPDLGAPAAPPRAPSGPSPARPGPVSPGKLVRFHCAGGNGAGPAAAFALSLTQVREIARPLPLTRVPGAPPFVLGLAPWRGRALPVVDLPRRLGLHGPEEEPSRAPRPGPARRLLVVRGAVRTELVAFPVDAEVRMAIPPADCRAAPARPPLDERAVRAVFDLGGQTLVLPDVDRLLTP